MRRPLLAACLGLALLAPAGGRPGDPEDVRSELNQIRKKLKMSKARLQQANQQEQGLSQELGVTQELLEEFSERLRVVRTELSIARSRHEILRQKVAESRDKLRRKRRALGQRLREMEIEGSASYLQVLLQARSFTQFLTYGEYMQRVVGSQKQLIEAVQSERKILEQRREAAQRTVNEIRGLETDYRERVLNLDDVRKQQKALLTRLQTHRRKLEAYVDGLEHSSAELEKRLQSIISQKGSVLGPIMSSGQFIYPVGGPITSPFGYRTHPILGTTRFHAGMDFGVGEGTPIRAADHGVVIHADWCGGYGNAVIIQHGHDISTLYGHCSRLLVHQGQAVRQGDVVGEVGSTGMSTGPHLHFEVRQGGTPVDPRGYL